MSHALLVGTAVIAVGALAACASPTGSSPSTSTTAASDVASSSATSDATPVVSPTPTQEPTAGSVDEWCQSVYEKSGIVEYVTRVNPTVPDDLKAVTGKTFMTTDDSAVIMCGGYQVIVTTAKYPTADAAAAGRASVADIHAGSPATIAGFTGDYAFTDPASGGLMGGGVSFGWQSDLSDFSAGIIVGSDSTTTEAELSAALEALVRVTTSTRLPGDGDLCAMSAEVYAATVEAGSAEMGVFDEGLIGDLVDYLHRVADKCGADVAKGLIASEEDAFSGGGFEMLQQGFAGQ